MLLSTVLIGTWASPASAQTAATGAIKFAVSNTAQAPLPMAESRYVSQTLQLGAWLKQSSEQALERLTNPYLKAFAQAEVAEQETVADVMRTLLGNRAVAPRYTTAQQRLILTQGRAQAGAAYDRAYLAGQLAVHRQLLAVQESYGQNATHTHLAIVAKLAGGHIRDHITLLEYMAAATKQ